MSNPSTASISDSHSGNQAARTLWVLVGIGAAVHLLFYGLRTVDDMFIFLRYAENFATGQGLVFNPGERVEGFSSPLWVMLLSVGSLLGVNLVTWSKLLSLNCFIALMWGMHRVGRDVLGLSPLFAIAPCALLASNSYIVSWTMWGLETPAYLALLLWVWYFAMRVCEGGGKRDAGWLILLGGGLSLARPEAPFFLMLIGLSVVFGPLKRAEILARMRRGVGPALVVIGIYASYLVFRKLYFGLWFPHTHYAKQGAGFEAGHWLSLIGQGANPFESLFMLGGLAGAIFLAWRRREWTPLALVGGTCFFVAVVLIDWMPNMRHYLPLWLVLPLAYTVLAEQAWKTAHRWRRWFLGSLGIVALGSGIAIGVIDARYSEMDFETHGRGEHWVRYKTPSAMWTAVQCLLRETPAHIQAMNDFEHGMVTQAYRLMEADSRPLAESWYIGRDIGRVGWLTPVRVFDTDGLFTPEVVASESWQETRVPDAALAARAFDRPVVMTELMQGWAQTVMSSPELRRGYPNSPRGYPYVHRRDRNGTAPAPEVIRRRYEYALGQMPSGYFVQTLYGEAVGAALARRAARIEEGLAQVTADAVPDSLEPDASVLLDEEIEALGCRVEPEIVEPGGQLRLSCYFRAVQNVGRDYRVFVHLRGPQGELPSNGDHEPQLGFVRTSDWEPGVIQRDVSMFTAPHVEDTEVQVRFGLYRGAHRAVVSRPEASDEEGRLLGPTFRVQATP